MVIKKLNISIKALYEGCIRSSLAHAIWARKYPFAKNAHYWDNYDCHFNDMEGNIATISFFDDGIVGAIFRHDYHKPPTISLNSVHIKSFLSKMPNKLKTLARTNTLQYFIQSIDDKEVPIATNIFWSVDDKLVSTIDHSNWVEIWGEIIRIQLMDAKESLYELQKDYGLNAGELQLTELLFNIKNKPPKKEINIKIDSVFEKILNNGERRITEELLARLGIFITA